MPRYSIVWDSDISPNLPTTVFIPEQIENELGNSLGAIADYLTERYGALMLELHRVDPQLPNRQTNPRFIHSTIATNPSQSGKGVNKCP